MLNLTAQTPSVSTALSPEQREWIRRQGLVSRAIEAARRQKTGRFSRAGVPAPPARRFKQPVAS
jgi:hypothetical protein